MDKKRSTSSPANKPGGDAAPGMPPAEPKWDPLTGNAVRGMWQTRQMVPTTDREILVRTTLRELVVYLVFLLVLTLLVYCTTSSTMYVFTKVLTDLLLETSFADDDDNTFNEATQMKDFWGFVQGPLLDGLYWDAWYDIKHTATERRDSMILYENKLLGVPRMRQLRVRSDSCRVPDDMRFFIKKCYAPYSWLTETEPGTKFGNGSGTAWKYQTDRKVGSRSYWGQMTTYEGGGSYTDLSTKRDKSERIIADLRKYLWLSRDTRAVFIDFTVYNANINLFCIIKLVFEFPATGGMITSSSFNTVKLIKYVTHVDYFAMACEAIFVVFILYYIVEEVIEVVKMRFAYFKNVWNVLDIVVIILGILCIAFSIYRSYTFDAKIAELLKDDIKHPNFEHLSFYQSQYNNAVALLVFFAWVKLFKYISFNKTMTQLSSTLSRCAMDIAGFAIMFFIVFFAFAQLGYLLFGTQANDFSSFKTATFTLLRTILGDFNFEEIQHANRVLGPIFFLSYVFFVFFVLMNMFLAIINDTYSEVKHEMASKKNEFEMGDYFKRGYNNLRGLIGKRDRLIDLRNALKLAPHDEDGNYSFDEIRKNLKRCGFSDHEMEVFFIRYDLSGRDIDADERAKILADLEDQRQQLGLDLEAIHRVVFGDITVEEAAAQLRGLHDHEHAQADRGDGGTPVEGEDYHPEDYHHEYNDTHDYYDDYATAEELTEVTRRVNHMEQAITANTAKMEVLMKRVREMEKRMGIRNTSVASDRSVSRTGKMDFESSRGNVIPRTETSERHKSSAYPQTCSTESRAKTDQTFPSPPSLPVSREEPVPMKSPFSTQLDQEITVVQHKQAPREESHTSLTSRGYSPIREPLTPVSIPSRTHSIVPSDAEGESRAITTTSVTPATQLKQSSGSLTQPKRPSKLSLETSPQLGQMSAFAAPRSVDIHQSAPSPGLHQTARPSEQPQDTKTLSKLSADVQYPRTASQPAFDSQDPKRPPQKIHESQASRRSSQTTSGTRESKQSVNLPSQHHDTSQSSLPQTEAERPKQDLKRSPAPAPLRKSSELPSRSPDSRQSFQRTLEPHEPHRTSQFAPESKQTRRTSQTTLEFKEARQTSQIVLEPHESSRVSQIASQSQDPAQASQLTSATSGLRRSINSAQQSSDPRRTSRLPAESDVSNRTSQLTPEYQDPRRESQSPSQYHALGTSQPQYEYTGSKGTMRTSHLAPQSQNPKRLSQLAAEFKQLKRLSQLVTQTDEQGSSFIHQESEDNRRPSQGLSESQESMRASPLQTSSHENKRTSHMSSESQGPRRSSKLSRQTPSEPLSDHRRASADSLKTADDKESSQSPKNGNDGGTSVSQIIIKGFSDPQGTPSRQTGSAADNSIPSQTASKPTINTRSLHRSLDIANSSPGSMGSDRDLKTTLESLGSTTIIRRMSNTTISGSSTGDTESSQVAKEGSLQSRRRSQKPSESATEDAEPL